MHRVDAGISLGLMSQTPIKTSSSFNFSSSSSSSSSKYSKLATPSPGSQLPASSLLVSATAAIAKTYKSSGATVSKALVRLVGFVYPSPLISAEELKHAGGGGARKGKDHNRNVRITGNEYSGFSHKVDEEEEEDVDSLGEFQFEEVKAQDENRSEGSTSTSGIISALFSDRRVLSETNGTRQSNRESGEFL